jgi:hypothetical protein
MMKDPYEVIKWNPHHNSASYKLDGLWSTRLYKLINSVVPIVVGVDVLKLFFKW